MSIAEEGKNSTEGAVEHTATYYSQKNCKFQFQDVGLIHAPYGAEKFHVGQPSNEMAHLCVMDFGGCNIFYLSTVPVIQSCPESDRVTRPEIKLARISCSLAIFVVAFSATPSIAVNDNIQITISTEIAPVFQNGELTGCALNFQAGKNDFTYFGGDLALINGSLNLYTAPGKAPFYALKLGVLRNGEQRFVAPSTAYILSDYQTNKTDFLSSVDAETPGFRLFMFSAEEASIDVMRETISKDKTIRIGYTMNDGSMSSIIPISLTMKNLNFENPSQSIIDEGAIKKWWECNLKALDAAIKRMEAE